MDQLGFWDRHYYIQFLKIWGLNKNPVTKIERLLLSIVYNIIALNQLNDQNNIKELSSVTSIWVNSVPQILKKDIDLNEKDVFSKGLRQFLKDANTKTKEVLNHNLVLLQSVIIIYDNKSEKDLSFIAGAISDIAMLQTEKKYGAC
jgi:hypothetical protein